MKILFLDIDGPLVNHRTHLVLQKKVEGGFMGSFDPIGIGLINLICEETGAQIVVSSTWRHTIPCVIGKLVAAGIKAEFHEDWMTPVKKGIRGEEIAEWLFSHPETTNWCAIDDSSDFLPAQMKNLVLVDGQNGIQLGDYMGALSTLGKTV